MIGSLQRYTFDRAPMLVYWEATRACALACAHCRAEAVPGRHPSELSTEEARMLFEQIASFPDTALSWTGSRRPHVVITGGDPLERPDIYELIETGRQLGLQMSITPAGTDTLTPSVIEELQAAGMHSLGLSLDGSSRSRHDSLRGVEGSFERTMTVMQAAADLQIPMQINTMVTAQTYDDLPAIYRLLSDIDIARWALFFLIPTGRGRKLSDVTPVQSERLLKWLVEIQPHSPFPIKTTEAHHYRRVIIRALQKRGLDVDRILRMPIGRGFGIRDGNGIMFVSHLGEVFPSGFLPRSAGNMRRRSVVEIYQDSELFRSIRNMNGLSGKCGRCEYRALCGGSRARALAIEGDVLASDPLCPYHPPSSR